MTAIAEIDPQAAAHKTVLQIVARTGTGMAGLLALGATGAGPAFTATTCFRSSATPKEIRFTSFIRVSGSLQTYDFTETLYRWNTKDAAPLFEN